MPQLRIVVLVKQVPDTANVTGEAMKEDGTINRAALPAVFNPEDLNALEEALKLKDRRDARVTVLTMGPPAAVQVLRESLYRGADEVILLTDKAFAGADTLATSYALSLAVQKLGGADLAGNPTLYDAVQKAKKTSVPNDNIDRAIKRGAGISGESIEYLNIIYEAYGPNGVALMVAQVVAEHVPTVAVAGQRRVVDR